MRTPRNVDCSIMGLGKHSNTVGRWGFSLRY